MAPGATPVLYEGIAPGVYRGNSAIVQAYAAQMVGLKSLEAEIIELTVDASGNLGTAFAVLRVTASTTDGQRRSATFRETDIFKRISGRWLIVHQHTSYPVDPRSGKALFDLDPRNCRHRKGTLNAAPDPLSASLSGALSLHWE